MISPTADLKLIVDAAAARGIFPGAAVFLARGDRVYAHAGFGTTAYEADYSKPVLRNTLYDLASLTKLFTATAWLMVAREDGIDAFTPVSSFLPLFNASDKGAIQIRHLLQHTSGIEIAIQGLTDEPTGSWVRRISEEPLKTEPGRSVLYSCTNFFLLARIIEKVTSEYLDDFIQENILDKLGMARTTFFPLRDWESYTAPTEIIDGEALHGVVHDEAARAWEKATGHASCGNAGLFGTALDLWKFCQLWSQDGSYERKQILAPEDVKKALTDSHTEVSPSARRGWGWQIDAEFYMSELAPPGSCGHAGFTGPTLWLNRGTGHVCIILNNRVHPNRNGPERFPTHRKMARVLLGMD